MAFYRDSKNRPKPFAMNSLTDRVSNVIAPIIADELSAGATAEEILGVIVQTAGCEVSSQAVVRATKERRAERRAEREALEEPSYMSGLFGMESLKSDEELERWWNSYKKEGE